MNINFWSAMLFFLSICELSESGGNKMNHKLLFPKSANSYAMLTTILPIDLHEFTLCYWVRINHLNKGSNTIFSYATESNDNEIRSYVEGHKDQTYFGFDRKTFFSARAPYKIHLGAWYHYCNIWSSWNGHWIIYINGEPVANGTEVAYGLPVQQGGLMVLGQDQDSVGGGFAPKDSLTGELLDLNLWDEILSSNVIADLAACLPFTGNIIAWLNSPLALHGGAVITPTQLCDAFTRPVIKCEAKSTTTNDQAEDENWTLPCWGMKC